MQRSKERCVEVLAEGAGRVAFAETRIERHATETPVDDRDALVKLVVAAQALDRFEEPRREDQNGRHVARRRRRAYVVDRDSQVLANLSCTRDITCILDQIPSSLIKSSSIKAVH